MIVECTSCHAKYKYDESRFEGKRSKKIKCAKCSAVFEIVNPSFDTVPASEIEDSTVQRREPRTEPRPTQTSVPPPADPTVDTTKELRISRDVLDRGGASLADSKKFSLAVISGPDAGKIFAVEKSHTTVGRSGADIVLNDTEISRKHCAIDVKEDRIVVADLGSTNGTWVGDQRIEESVLTNQGEFLVGASTLMLIITDKD